MPRHAYTIKRGSTGQQILLFATREGSGEGAVGLRYDASGARAGYVRAGERAVALPLAGGRVGEWTPGGFAEVDRDLLPGVYQLGLPDAMLAAGAPRAMLILGFPGARIEPVQVELVAFDPQDPVRLGMSALGPEARIQALQGAFPLLAKREIEERMALLAAQAPERPHESS